MSGDFSIHDKNFLVPQQNISHRFFLIEDFPIFFICLYSKDIEKSDTKFLLI